MIKDGVSIRKYSIIIVDVEIVSGSQVQKAFVKSIPEQVLIHKTVISDEDFSNHKAVTDMHPY